MVSRAAAFVAAGSNSAAPAGIVISSTWPEQSRITTSLRRSAVAPTPPCRRDGQRIEGNRAAGLAPVHHVAETAMHRRTLGKKGKSKHGRVSNDCLPWYCRNPAIAI